MIPCCLCHLNFTVAVPEEELIQVTVISSHGPPLISELYRKQKWECLPNALSFLHPVNRISPPPSQVTVTAVAMTFDRDQTQEKPGEKVITKGLFG